MVIDRVTSTSCAYVRRHNLCQLSWRWSPWLVNGSPYGSMNLETGEATQLAPVWVPLPLRGMVFIAFGKWRGPAISRAPFSWSSSTVSLSPGKQRPQSTRQNCIVIPNTIYIGPEIVLADVYWTAVYNCTTLYANNFLNWFWVHILFWRWLEKPYARWRNGRLS